MTRFIPEGSKPPKDTGEGDENGFSWFGNQLELVEEYLSMAKAKELNGKKVMNKASSEPFDPYSVKDALVALDIVDPTYYNKAIEKFTILEWHNIFIKMPMSRKYLWLEGL
ncbi:hypothetical protein F0562_006464 [Nyssa sinensis]|uniref:Uncharacterized protein n=1 Tax=Nyssa sinensis TaxID=561372 RepID=A0A5J5ANL0_9ASTE|nr:hypothetical protein F0562_006464 [Nyssa sinensis]